MCNNLFPPDPTAHEISLLGGSDSLRGVFYLFNINSEIQIQTRESLSAFLANQSRNPQSVWTGNRRDFGVSRIGAMVASSTPRQPTGREALRIGENGGTPGQRKTQALTHLVNLVCENAW